MVFHGLNFPVGHEVAALNAKCLMYDADSKIHQKDGESLVLDAYVVSDTELHCLFPVEAHARNPVAGPMPAQGCAVPPRVG